MPKQRYSVNDRRKDLIIIITTKDAPSPDSPASTLPIEQTGLFFYIVNIG
jgi:hypothetical protein